MHKATGETTRGVMRVAHHARSAALVRRWLAEQLNGLSSELVADATMVGTELVANAIRHATPLPGGVVSVGCEVTDTHIEISVTDGGADTTPEPRKATMEDVDGRGLTIVDALAQRWGVRTGIDGQSVWAWLGPVRAALTGGPGVGSAA
ncbi:hypothetical protein Pen01_04910 [Phytomonospora endophytica]|nr:hypothetical protein Pen01_04910 [Phytomonospora endophytica]